MIDDARCGGHWRENQTAAADVWQAARRRA